MSKQSYLLILSALFLGVWTRNLNELPDCSNLGCPSNVQLDPVCGTDGRTYATQCEMELENQKRICWIGHFNMIYKAHDGPCEPTTTVRFTG